MGAVKQQMMEDAENILSALLISSLWTTTPKPLAFSCFGFFLKGFRCS